MGCNSSNPIDLGIDKTIIKSCEENIGFKGFYKGLYSLTGFKYKIGHIYEIKGELKLCENGINFCLNPLDVELFFTSNSNIEYCIIQALGDIEHYYDLKLSITNKIKIIKKISRKELLNYFTV
jgi:hypothetical protein